MHIQEMEEGYASPILVYLHPGSFPRHSSYGKAKANSQGSELLLNQRFTALTRFFITFYMVLPSYLFIYLSINKSFRNKFALVGFRTPNLSPLISI